MAKNRGYLVLLAGVLGLTQIAWSGYITSYGASVHWADSEIPFVIDARGSTSVANDAEFEAIQRSMDTWNAVDCEHPQFVYDGEVTGIKALAGENETDGTNIIIWESEEEWPYPTNTKTIALTTLFYNPLTGVAEESDMELADFAYTFTVTPGTDGASTDIENTITHELGHVLGLDHSSDKEATMYYSSPNAEISKRDLNHDDRTGLCTIYTGIAVPDEGAQEGPLDSGEPTEPVTLSESACAASPTGALMPVLVVMGLCVAVAGSRRRGSLPR